MSNRLFISTKEAYIPLAEVTHAQYVPSEENSIEIFGTTTNGLGTIATSSPEEALWFMKSIFANLGIKEPLIMDYIQKKVINVKTVSIPLAQVTQEEEMITKETYLPISHIELEEK
ncbi:MAG: hypothetical protein ABFD15_06650 [Methanofastidiosum sp.]